MALTSDQINLIKKELARRELESRNTEKPKTTISEQDLSGKYIPQLTKALYENLPFGKRLIDIMPMYKKEVVIANLENTPPPSTVRGLAGNIVGTALPQIALAAPFMGAAGALRVPGFIKTALGIGAFSGVQAAAQNKPVVESAVKGAAEGALFGVAGKVGASVVPKIVPGAARIGTALGMGAAGALTGEEGSRLQNAMFSAGLGALFPEARNQINRGKIGMNRAAKRKVVEIRQKTRNYHSQEVKAYGDAIEKLPSEPIKGAPILENMERMLVERQVFTPDGQIVKRPLSTVDSKLLKEYELLYKKWATTRGGTLDSKDVIKTYQEIKGKFRTKPDSMTKARSDAAGEFFDAVRPQIKSGEFTAANQRYRIFKQNEAAIDKYFKIWDDDLLTGSGEMTLRNLYKPEQKDLSKLVESLLGVNLGRAKLDSYINKLSKNPAVRVGGGIAAGSAIGAAVAKATGER